MLERSTAVQTAARPGSWALCLPPAGWRRRSAPSADGGTCLNSALQRSHRQSIAFVNSLISAARPLGSRGERFRRSSQGHGLPHAAALLGAVREAMPAGGAAGTASGPSLLGARTWLSFPRHLQPPAAISLHSRGTSLPICPACRLPGSRLWRRRLPPPPPFPAAAGRWRPSQPRSPRWWMRPPLTSCAPARTASTSWCRARAAWARRAWPPAWRCALRRRATPRWWCPLIQRTRWATRWRRWAARGCVGSRIPMLLGV